MNECASQTLPPELHSTVIDCLRDDKTTIAACSLVCLSWLSSSRNHLFHALTIDVNPSQHGSTDRLADFIQCLERSEASIRVTPKLGYFIKELTITGNSQICRCTLSTLDTLLHKLPQLKSLSLRSLCLTDDRSDITTLQIRAGPAPSIDELTISSCTAPERDPHHLLALVCMFSGVRSLAISGGMWSPTPLSDGRIFEPPAIQSLAIEAVASGSASHAIFGLLANAPSDCAGHITHVRFAALDREELQVFSGFVRGSGATLRTLDLSINPPVLETLVTGEHRPWYGVFNDSPRHHTEQHGVRSPLRLAPRWSRSCCTLTATRTGYGRTPMSSSRCPRRFAPTLHFSSNTEACSRCSPTSAWRQSP